MNLTGAENCTTGSKKTKKPKMMCIDGKKTPMNEGSQISITKETMMIENMGFVVGRNGCNLKRLKDNYTESS